MAHKALAFDVLEECDGDEATKAAVLEQGMLVDVDEDDSDDEDGFGGVSNVGAGHATGNSDHAHVEDSLAGLDDIMLNASARLANDAQTAKRRRVSWARPPTS